MIMPFAIRFSIANPRETEDTIQFLNRYRQAIMVSAPGREMLCNQGTRSAIRKGLVVVARYDTGLIGAMRYYRRKSNSVVSVYQFAVDASYRGYGVFDGLLLHTGGDAFEAACLQDAPIVQYFHARGWSEIGQFKNQRVFGIHRSELLDAVNSFHHRILIDE